MDDSLFRFELGTHARGFASPLLANRVGLNFAGQAGGVSFNVTMSAAEARAVANALQEAADAAEKLPVPVVGA